MAYGFELIVPAYVETQLTGYVGGVRQSRKNTTLEIKFYVQEPRIRCDLDGKSVSWDRLPVSTQQRALDGLKMLASAHTAP